MDLITFILFVAGFVLLVFGAGLLVRGASRLAIAVGISPLVVGLTVVAYGTSSPELAVSVQSSYAGQADLALGNVVGSNIANILLILGISATITPLVVSQRLVRLDVPLMVGLSFLLLLMGWDRNLSRLEGVILLTGAVGYTIFTIRQSRRENRLVQQEYAQEFNPDSRKQGLKSGLIQLGMIGIGLALLVLGARWLVEGAVVMARFLGVSELVIGLTVVAVGTSLPEIATSTIASLRNERDIAIGNVVGSNIFNILFVLGLASITAPAGIAVPGSALRFDIPIMIVAAVACLPIFFTGSRIARWEGILFLGYYLVYTIYLFLHATGHGWLDEFSMMLFFVVPLTVITLFVSFIQEVIQINGRNSAVL